MSIPRHDVSIILANAFKMVEKEPSIPLGKAIILADTVGYLPLPWPELSEAKEDIVAIELFLTFGLHGDKIGYQFVIGEGYVRI